MKCRLSDVCVNYPHKCLDCETLAQDVNYLPYCEKRKPPITKFKIFWGNHTNVSADVKLNQWLADNPSVELVDWQYQQVRLGDHSICITYKEKENT